MQPLTQNRRSIHGTCVAINGQGILITGKPGSGKSSFALHLIQCGHQLISDDLTTITKKNHQLIASCPPHIKNILHTRTLGFIDISKSFGPIAIADNVPINLVIHLRN